MSFDHMNAERDLGGANMQELLDGQFALAVDRRLGCKKVERKFSKLANNLKIFVVETHSAM